MTTLRSAITDYFSFLRFFFNLAREWGLSKGFWWKVWWVWGVRGSGGVRMVFGVGACGNGVDNGRCK